MIPYQIHGSFICDKCRNICKGGCHEKLTAILDGDMANYEENKDLVGRKQIIHCLGKYCDSPCKLQREDFTPFRDEDGIQPLIDLIKWMGQRLHDSIEKKR